MRSWIENWRFCVTVLLLCGTLTASRLSEDRKLESLARPLTILPTRIDGWTAGPDQSLDPHVVTVLKPTSYLVRTYAQGARQIGLFIAYYAGQRAGESMHSPKVCLPASGWGVAASDTAVVPVGGRCVTVNKYLVEKGADRLVVLYWYQSKQRIVASEYLGKLFLVRDAVLEGRTAGSIVRLTLPNEPDSVKEGVSFASRIINAMQLCF